MKKSKIPRHIAIIMDGNRRWAKKRRLPILAGHDYAAKKVLENIVEAAAKRGVEYLTLWAFSTENWQRDKSEVTGLMQLIRWNLAHRIDSFVKKGVRLLVIGDLKGLPQDIQEGVKSACEKTKNGRNITAILAVNYGGRDEIIRAISKLRENPKSEMRNPKLLESQFDDLLDTKDIPDPDLLIRTGGEKRLSGFLPWQTIYTELYFTDTLWPDFSPHDLDLAIEEYQKRERRFGR